MAGKDLTNTFFDINKFPALSGLLIFPISMSRISNSQSGKKYFDILKKLSSKIIKTEVGVNFVYTDSLYSKYQLEKSASRDKYSDLVISHKNSFLKNIRKDLTYVEPAFSFTVWSQLIIGSKNFLVELKQVHDFYEKDASFKKFVHDDIKRMGKTVSEKNVGFILEETLLTYLILKDEISLQNDFVNGREKWRLLAYPGPPHKSMIYFFQKDPFRLQSTNIYQAHHYDLDANKLYDYTRIDLSTFDF